MIEYPTDRYVVEGNYLEEWTGSCTCGEGGMRGHEPGCGLELVFDLSVEEDNPALERLKRLVVDRIARRDTEPDRSAAALHDRSISEIFDRIEETVTPADPSLITGNTLKF